MTKPISLTMMVVLLALNMTMAESNILDKLSSIKGQNLGEKDWKSLLTGYCLKEKEKIEANPDDEFYRSSIAISHFDNLMALVDKATVYDVNIIGPLKKAISVKQDFEKAYCPDLCIGINRVNIKRFKNAAMQEFVVLVPTNYTGKEKMPVIFYPDIRKLGRRTNYSNYQKNIINVWWTTVNNKNIDWRSFDYFMIILHEKLNIDRNKIYIEGQCGNGLAAMTMATERPDIWALFSSSLGNSNRHLASNVYNLSTVFVKGTHQEPYLVSYYDFAVKCFEYFQCRDLKHSKPKSTAQLIGSDITIFKKQNDPNRIIYRTQNPDLYSAYWFTIDSREDENFMASVDAVCQGQKIILKTENIQSYSIDFESCPIDGNESIEIIENGKLIEYDKLTEKTCLPLKHKYLSGPIKDVFKDDYVIIYTTKYEKVSSKIGKNRIGIDDVTQEILSNNNIIFVGDVNEYPANNAHLKMPIKIDGSKIITHWAEYDDAGAIFVGINPANKNKYVALFTACSDKAIEKLPVAWKNIQNRDVDIAIYTTRDSFEFVLREKLDCNWNWHKNWDKILMRTIKNYPLWKWQQWLGDVVKTQTDADFVIFEEPFRKNANFPVGNINLHQLNNVLDNIWIVKISLNGSQIRKMLLAPFSMEKSRDASKTVISGLTMKKNSAKNISIGEIKNDQSYSVAFPYRAINGQRLGTILRNYTITGDYFLVKLLKDYLEVKQNLNEAENEIKLTELNIF